MMTEFATEIYLISHSCNLVKFTFVLDTDLPEVFNIII